MSQTRTTYAGRIENTFTALDDLELAIDRGEMFEGPDGENLAESWDKNDILQDRGAMEAAVKRIFSYQNAIAEAGQNLAKLGREYNTNLESITGESQGETKDTVYELRKQYFEKIDEVKKNLRTDRNVAQESMYFLNQESRILGLGSIFRDEKIFKDTTDIASKLSSQYAYIGDRIIRSLEYAMDMGKEPRALVANDHFDITDRVCESAKIAIEHVGSMTPAEKRLLKIAKPEVMKSLPEGNYGRDVDIHVVKSYPTNPPLKETHMWMPCMEDATGKFTEEAVVGAMRQDGKKNKEGRSNLYILETEWKKLTKENMPLVRGYIYGRIGGPGNGKTWREPNGRIISILAREGFSLKLSLEEQRRIFKVLYDRGLLKGVDLRRYCNLVINKNQNHPERQEQFRALHGYVSSLETGRPDKGSEKANVFDVKR